MITAKERKHAERIVELADRLGHLPINTSGQTVEGLLDLSIPLARLVVAELVTGFDRDSSCGMCEQAVADVEAYCLRGLAYSLEHGVYDAATMCRLAEVGGELGLDLSDELASAASVVGRYRTVRS